MKNTEEWRPIVGYEGYYEVSCTGEVISLDREIMRSNGRKQKINGKMMEGYINQDGYLRMTLSAGGNVKQVFAHRLVAETFIPNPEDHSEINHIDEDKLNNSVENLEWCDHAHNMDHSMSKTWKMRDPEGQVVMIRNLTKFSKDNGLDYSSMCKVGRGVLHSYLGWHKAPTEEEY